MFNIACCAPVNNDPSESTDAAPVVAFDEHPPQQEETIQEAKAEESKAVAPVEEKKVEEPRKVEDVKEEPKAEQLIISEAPVKDQDSPAAVVKEAPKVVDEPVKEADGMVEARSLVTEESSKKAGWKINDKLAAMQAKVEGKVAASIAVGGDPNEKAGWKINQGLASWEDKVTTAIGKPKSAH